MPQPSHQLHQLHPLSIRAFGALEFTLGEQPLRGIEYNKVRALLLVLALSPQRPQTRAALCALLWPDLPERAARNNLSQALTNLRKVIRTKDQGDAPFVLATTEAVQLNPASTISIAVDVCRFEALLETSERHAHHSWHTCAVCTARLQQAMQLYRADFLAEFSLPDSAPFEEWAEIQRQRLHQYALSALNRLIRAAEWRGQAAIAIDYARRLVALDPLNEAGHRELIRLLACDEQWAAARKQYASLRHTLAQEINAEPEPATQALLAQLNAGMAGNVSHTHLHTHTHASTLSRFQAPLSHLPTPPAPLIGRERDLDAVTQLLREQRTRLISLIGTAGVGKTRLMLSLAHTLRFDYTHGAHWVDLAPLADAAQLLPAIAQTLRLTDDSPEAVIGYLRHKHVLLLLDNFEHLLAEADECDAAARVADLLAQAPHLAILITSRTALRIRAEQQYALAPLAQSAAVQLFVDRARAAQFDFALNADNTTAIHTLCQKLEGLPLAIELIAAQVGTTSPAKLIEQWEQQMPLLGDGPRDAPERHRTLHDAIDWSVQLLSEPQRDLFAHLAVFAGGFDAAAAEAVQAHTAADLDALARSSLIQSQAGNQSGAATRWAVLEPVRQFAALQLIGQGAWPAAKSRHAAHYLAVAEAAGPNLLGPEASVWMQRLEADHANLQATLQWAMFVQQPGMVLRIGQGIFRFWYRRGLWREGLTWLEQALAIDDTDTPTNTLITRITPTDAPIEVRINALRAAGVMAQMLSLFERADRHYLASLALAQQHEDSALIAAASHNLGSLRKDQGRFEEALAYFDQSIATVAEQGLKFPWQSKADTLSRLGRFAEAKILYENAMALNRRIGDEEGLAHTLRGLAEVACRGGDAATAERLLRENETICRKLNHARGLSWTAQQFGSIARVRGDWQAARNHYNEAMAQMEAMGDAWGRCDVLAMRGHLAVAEGNYAQAEQDLQDAQAGWQQLGANLTPFERAEIERSLAQCRTRMA